MKGNVIQQIILKFRREAAAEGFSWMGTEVIGDGLFSGPLDEAGTSYIYRSKPTEACHRLPGGVAACLAFLVEARRSAIDRPARKGRLPNAATTVGSPFVIDAHWVKNLEKCRMQPASQGDWQARLMGYFRAASPSTATFCTVISQVILVDRSGGGVRASLNTDIINPTSIRILVGEQADDPLDMREVSEWLIAKSVCRSRSTQRSSARESRSDLAENTGGPGMPSPVAYLPGRKGPVEVACIPLLEPRDILAVGFDHTAEPISIEANKHDVIIRWLENEARMTCLRGHGSRVLCAALSIDGRYLVTGGADASVRIWRLDPPAELWASNNLGGWVTCVACSFAGEVMIAGCGDALHAFLFNSEISSEVGHIDRRVSWQVQCVTLSANGTTAFAGGTNKRLWRWNLSNGDLTAMPSSHIGSVLDVDCDQSGDRVISGGSDAYLIFSSRDSVLLDERQAVGISRVRLSPDGWHALVGYLNGEVGVWDLKHRYSLLRWNHSAELRALAFDQSSQNRVIAADKQMVRIQTLPLGNP